MNKMGEDYEHTLVVLVGPSAIGKTYWIDTLIERYAGKLRRVRNTTTRAAREAQDATAYRTVSREEFERGIADNMYLEWDTYLDEYYGSSLGEITTVLKETHGIFALTPSGAQALHENHCSNVRMAIILLAPASTAVLVQNFVRRGITDKAKQAQLIAAAEAFTLPSDMLYATVLITGDSKKDTLRFDDLFSTLLPD
jgi:guanylate kinase